MKSNLLTLQQIICFIKEYHHIDDLEIKNIESSYELVCKCIIDKIGPLNSNINEEKFNYYVKQSLSVAKYIASWRFDYTVVIASLFHVLLANDIKPLEELKPLIEENIYIILKGYNDIHNQIRLFKIKREDVSEEYLSSPYPESFYIEIAAHVNILACNLNSNDEKILDFAQDTREHLIPQVKHIHAYWMVDFLEELCFKIENRVVYKKMVAIIQQVDNLNEFYCWQFITKLNRIFDKNSNITPSKLHEIQSSIKLFYANKRSVISIYRFITQNDPIQQIDVTLDYDLKKLKNFSRTAFYDLTLVLDDVIESEKKYSLIDVFMQYFEAMLRSEGVFIYGCYQTTKKEAFYFLISDPMKNIYRFFVKTESQYLHYLYGDIIAREKFNLNYLTRRNESRIKVFRKDGTAEMVKKGTTVLDFAFMIHEDLGLHFGSAILNQNERLLPAHTILNNGDTVEIKKSEKITAELNWFRYLKTDVAVNYLIKFFKTQYKRSNGNIKVLTKDGSVAWIQEGSTVLDFAFMVNRDKGLCFDYALINNNNERYSVDYVLCDGDIVTIQKSPVVKADYYWFRHVKTKKAINYLIDYFEHV